MSINTRYTYKPEPISAPKPCIPASGGCRRQQHLRGRALCEHKHEAQQEFECRAVGSHAGSCTAFHSNSTMARNLQGRGRNASQWFLSGSWVQATLRDFLSTSRILHKRKIRGSNSRESSESLQTKRTEQLQHRQQWKVCTKSYISYSELPLSGRRPSDNPTCYQPHHGPNVEPIEHDRCVLHSTSRDLPACSCSAKLWNSFWETVPCWEERYLIMSPTDQFVCKRNLVNSVYFDKRTSPWSCSPLR